MTRLKQKRQEVGLMQIELAERSGVSAPYIHDLEAGNRGAREDTWARIAAALGCTVEEIVEPEAGATQ